MPIIKDMHEWDYQNTYERIESLHGTITPDIIPQANDDNKKWVVLSKHGNSYERTSITGTEAMRKFAHQVNTTGGKVVGEYKVN